MYPAFDWSISLLAIMGISAGAISLAERPDRAIWVTSKLEAAIGGGGRRPFMIITQLNYGSAPALRNCTFMSSAHLGLRVLIIVVGSPLG
jgi:hypothetical protein